VNTAAVNTVLRGCSVEFVWCGVLGAFLRMCWRVRVCAPADLPPCSRVPHWACGGDDRALWCLLPYPVFLQFFGCFGCGL